jgi:hypothetical protein
MKIGFMMVMKKLKIFNFQAQDCAIYMLKNALDYRMCRELPIAIAGG